jgi:hypothetical protein
MAAVIQQRIVNGFGFPAWGRMERVGEGLGRVQVGGAWRRIRNVTCLIDGAWVTVSDYADVPIAVSEYHLFPDPGFDDPELQTWLQFWNFDDPTVDWTADGGENAIRLTAVVPAGGFRRIQAGKSYPAAPSQTYQVRVRAKSTVGTNQIGGLLNYGPFNCDFFVPGSGHVETTPVNITSSYAWYTFNLTLPASGTDFVRPGFNVVLPTNGNQVLVSDITCQRTA